MKKSILAVAVLSVLLMPVMFGLLIYRTWSPYILIPLSFGIGATVLFLVLVSRKIKASPTSGRLILPYYMSIFLLFLIMPVFLCAYLIYCGTFSIVLLVVTVALTFNFFYNTSNTPLAIYHKYAEDKLAGQPVLWYPMISIIVPAHNEEKCLPRTIKALVETEYPYKEIIVVDDGSTDRTYEIAQRYHNEGVIAVRRPNGGKSRALNYGLLFARGEIIICVDADSLIHRMALLELVRIFQDPLALAVAGNVKVINRSNFLTKCQALEYIVDINIIKRAFDIFGAIPVIPGCLSAFHRETLEGVGAWAPATLTEDFDSSIQVLKAGTSSLTSAPAYISSQNPDVAITYTVPKAGKVVQMSSRAMAFTEAPESLRDLWNQRLRWYRGTLQVLWKHRDAFINRRFGFLYALTFPYLSIGTFFMPVAAVAVIASAIVGIMNGEWIGLLSIFGIFVLLQFLHSVLAIQLDDEDVKLALYSPFLVIGYKHFLDIAKLVSLYDITTNRKVTWSRVKRMGFESARLSEKAK